MGGSWRIGTISGIGIYLHWTFLILLGWISVLYAVQGQSLTNAIYGIVLVMAVFAIVVLHELGHALAARRYGIATKDITLLPIGGVARLERMPDEPKEELVVALAGPAVNVVLAVLCVLGMIAVVGVTHVSGNVFTGVRELGYLMENQWQVANAAPFVAFLDQLLFVNVMLILFNLLPAFPMDGGRVLRAILAMNIDYVRATQIAATVGKVMAVVFAFVGLFIWHNPLLVFIALFVWLGAASEASMVQVRSGLHGIPVAQAMVSEFRTLAPQDRLGDAARHIIAGFQQDFPVADDGRVIGVLTKTDLFKQMMEQGPDATVETVMCRTFEQADPGEMLDTVFARLEGCNCRAIPVVRQGSLVGMLTMENVGEFLAIRSALGASRA